MIEWPIGLLQEYAGMGNAGQVAFVATILVPILATFGFTRVLARRGYETSAEMAQKVTVATNDLQHTKDKLATLRRDHADLQSERDALYNRLPEGVIARLEKHLADGNSETATRDIYEILAEFRPMLTTAFAHLAREEVKNVAASEDLLDQARTWRLARDNARIALALTPDHIEMATLEEELRVATAAAEQGLKVIPTDDSIRELRWKARQHLDRSVPALLSIWRRGIDHGNYLTTLSTAREARRLAGRGGNEGSPNAMAAGQAVAHALMRLGRNAAALAEGRKVALAQADHLGPDAPQTLATRHLIAAIQSRLGNHKDAMSEAQAVRQAGEARADIRLDHPHTLRTGLLVAEIHQRAGDNGTARQQLNTVKPRIVALGLRPTQNWLKAMADLEAALGGGEGVAEPVDPTPR